MFHYGYFVISQNGRLAPAGDDWGPTPDSYKPEQELGTKNGVKATVVEVIKGQEAALNQVDVMILVKEERTQELHRLEWIRHVASCMASARPRRLTSWPQMQAEFHGQKLRAVRNKFYARPKGETFQDFCSFLCVLNHSIAARHLTAAALLLNAPRRLPSSEKTTYCEPTLRMYSMSV